MRTLFVGAAVLAAAQTAAPPQANTPAAGTRNAIVGRVTTPDGAPVARAIVTLLERSAARGRSQLRIVSARLQIPTDADGRYAIPEARLGEFYVVAIPQNAMRTPGGAVNRQGYAITYHPSARTADDATMVRVNVLGPQTADIRLIAAPLATVRGSVYDSNDELVPDAEIHVAHGDSLYGIGSAAARGRGDGTFAFGGIPPGTYFLQYRESQWPPPRGEMAHVSMATVVVDGRDVTGVRVAPVRPVHVEGRLIVAEADRAQLPSTLTVGASPTSFEGNPGPRPPGRLSADLTFAFDTWPGPSYIHVLPESAGWTIKRVRYRGEDVTDAGIDFKPGERVSGIDVELVRGR